MRNEYKDRNPELYKSGQTWAVTAANATQLQRIRLNFDNFRSTLSGDTGKNTILGCAVKIVGEGHAGNFIRGNVFSEYTEGASSAKQVSFDGRALLDFLAGALQAFGNISQSGSWKKEEYLYPDGVPNTD